MTTHKADLRLRDSIRRQQLALATAKTYRGWLRRFMVFLRAQSAGPSSEEKVEIFLTDLARRRCSSSQQNQALNALAFFYRHVLERPLAGVNALRVTRPAGIRIAPSAAVVQALLAEIRDTPSQPMILIASLLYGCGPRLNEALALRLKDVDTANSRLWIRDGNTAANAWSRCRADRARGGIVAEGFFAADARAHPGLLGKKFPHAEYSRDWRWLLPAAEVCTDQRSGRIVRWRCHPALVQRAFALASERAGLRPSLTPHHLRHAYAAHCLDVGVNVRALQAAMGHKSLETTMATCTPTRCR